MYIKALKVGERLRFGDTGISISLEKVHGRYATLSLDVDRSIYIFHERHNEKNKKICARIDINNEALD